jgi:hypothetical protein
MARHVFLSFVVEDKGLVDLFRGQARNKNSELVFDDYSVKAAYDSQDAAYIRGRIRERIRACSVTVCLIGETTASSKWVNWELLASGEEKNRLLGVRLHSSSTRDKTPKALSDLGAKVVDWDIDAIVKFIG